MAGDANTRVRADMFDVLLEDGPLKLTAITRKSWGDRVEVADRVLFHFAENKSVTHTAAEVGVSQSMVVAIVTESGEPEFD